MKIKTKSISSLLVIAVLLLATVFQVLLPNNADAAQITSRKLTLQAGATDGGSMPGGTVNHEFEFTMPAHGSGNELGSIKFEYCTTAADTGALTCIVPTGLTTTGATLGTVSGVATGFTMNNSVNGAPYVTRTAATAAAGAETIQLLSVVNPTTVNTTFFVRISSYTSTNATGTPIHSGTVAAAVTNPIVISGTMPESLVFCAAETIGLTSGVPDCSTAVDGAISFDRLFSPVDTATAESQLSASTNAGSGYAITVNGATLTSGANTIAGMNNAGAAAAPAYGVSQFGLNLVLNSTTLDITSNPLGADVSVASNGTNFKGAPGTNYGTADLFKFVTGDQVAQSNNGGLGGSDAQIYTVSYVVNVPGSLPAGTYSTTLTYICTPTY
ncbi:MAG: hypothetical protein ACO1N2_03430 [Candidatus Saccharimonadota bacterium]